RCATGENSAGRQGARIQPASRVVLTIEAVRARVKLDDSGCALFPPRAILLDVCDAGGRLAEDLPGGVRPPAPIGIDPISAEPFVPEPNPIDQAASEQHAR